MNSINFESFGTDHDVFFAREILTPYLSSVYFSMVQRGKKNYLCTRRMKQYLDLPELLGLRIVNLINANGDERIDHDEFVDFFLKLTMGTFEQKMKIAFGCYDADHDESISEDEVELILRNLPLTLEERFGSSFNPLHGNRI